MSSKPMETKSGDHGASGLGLESVAPRLPPFQATTNTQMIALEKVAEEDDGEWSVVRPRASHKFRGGSSAGLSLPHSRATGSQKQSASTTGQVRTWICTPNIY